MNYKQPLSLLLAIVFVNFFAISNVIAQENKPDLPAKKQTTLGLYVTSAEAYSKWEASPKKVKVLDVRTPEEYIFIGHASMAYNVPLAMQTYNWDPKTNEYAMKPVSDFVDQVKKIAKPTDVILVTCRSGGRSAMAVNQLAAAGFKNVYNITDGFEGDMVKDQSSLYYEKRMQNGWKNSNLPWTYELNQDQIITPSVSK
jgi:rhodanese-related sulfurtransferase